MFGKGKSLFAGVEKVELGMQREPFMRPKNIRRDPTEKDPKKNILSCEDAIFIVQNLKMEVFESTQTRGAAWIKSTFLVLWTDCDDPEVQAGKTVVHMIDCNGRFFLKDIASYVCALTNKPPEAFAPAHYEEMVGVSQPVAANKLCAMVKIHNKKTDAGNDFFQHWFSPIGIQRDAAGNYVGHYEVEDLTRPKKD